MNPLALFLLAAAAGSGRMSSGADRNFPGNTPVKLDALVSQLQGAVNTLEKVGELSRMGSNLGSNTSGPASLAAPASAHIPVSAEVMEESRESGNLQPAQSSLPNIDLQSAIQALAPLLSMLTGNQNSR